MNLRTLLVTAVLVFVLSGVARAAELSTALMYASGTSYLICSIVNVSSAPQTVRIRSYYSTGEVSADSGDRVVAPRATESLGIVSSGHCRFTTVNAKTLFRASILVYDGTKVVASLPAQ